MTLIRFMRSTCILSIILIALIGCNQCSEPFERIVLLSEEHKNVIPYSGDETLVYVNNHGDTTSLDGQGRSTSIEEVGASSDKCFRGVYHLEKDKTTFESVDQEFKFILIFGTHETGVDFLIEINDNCHYANTILWADPDLNILEINGMEYQSIYELNGLEIKTFYNKEFGILRFIENDTITWDLLR